VVQRSASRDGQPPAHPLHSAARIRVARSYDATARGFVGPIGVIESARGHGIGAALVLACLHDMRSAGYGYAIAGHVGEPEFFKRVANAIEIPDSTPGLYANMLRPEPGR
jgi:predicted N-acetyltransferase YhbS